MAMSPAEARARARQAEARYRTALLKTAEAVERRKMAMMNCLEAGLSLKETGELFHVTRPAVQNVRREIQARLTPTRPEMFD